MIINGASYRCIWWWTRHFADTKENVRTNIIQSKGLASDNIHDMMCEMKVMADASRSENARWQNFMWICDLSPEAHESRRLSEDQWDRMRQIIEERRGLPGQVYFMIEQEKADGRIHRHLVEMRIDLETGRAIPDGKDAQICHAASRQICEELGLARTPSPFDKDREGPRPERAPKRWESYRAMKTGLAISDIEAEVTALFQQSDNGLAFKAALEQHGYMLVRGDRRCFVILDSAGKDHSLARRIDGVTTKELNAFMRDVDRNALPGVAEGKALHQERNLAELEADRRTVRHEIEWEEKLAKDAIEKEKREGRFVAPEDREKTPAGQLGKEPVQHREPIPVTPENQRNPRVRIWNAWDRSDSAQAFAAALDQQGIALAAVTKEEANLSHRTAAYPKAIGNSVPEYRAGEIVAITERGHVYQLNRRTTGRNQQEIDAFLAPLDRSHLQGIEVTKETQKARAEQRWAERSKPAPQPGREAPTVAAKDRGSAILERAAVNVVLKAPFAALNVIEKPLQLVEDLFEGLLAPQLTPEQIREGEIAAEERKAESEQKIDFSNYTTERVRAEQNQKDQEATRERPREVERER